MQFVRTMIRTREKKGKWAAVSNLYLSQQYKLTMQNEGRYYKLFLFPIEQIIYEFTNFAVHFLWFAYRRYLQEGRKSELAEGGSDTLYLS